MARTQIGFVEVGKLSHQTKRAWGIDREFMEPEQAAWLWFRLRKHDDTDEMFPRGKWASIQYLEALIDEQAEVAEIADGG